MGPLQCAYCGHMLMRWQAICPECGREVDSTQKILHKVRRIVAACCITLIAVWGGIEFCLLGLHGAGVIGFPWDGLRMLSIYGFLFSAIICAVLTIVLVTLRAMKGDVAAWMLVTIIMIALGSVTNMLILWSASNAV